MKISKGKQEAFANSPYPTLYSKIRAFITHENKRVSALGSELQEALSTFEKHPSSDDAQVKNQFRKDFLKILHSLDCDGSVRTILNHQHVSTHSIFKEKNVAKSDSAGISPKFK
jgi:hypothetical protein